MPNPASEMLEDPMMTQPSLFSLWFFGRQR